MKHVDVLTKGGKTINVRRDEIPGLLKAKVLDESKLSDELKKPLKKADGNKVTGQASNKGINEKVKNLLKKKVPKAPAGHETVELKSGKFIKVKKREVKGLEKAGLLKDGKAEAKAAKAAEKAEKEAKELADKEAKAAEKADKEVKEAKEKEEKENAKTKEEKGTGETKELEGPGKTK